MPAHPNQANQISSYHTITKEWSDVWGNHWTLRQVNLQYYFLGSERKHRGRWNDTEGETGHCFSEIECNQEDKIGAPEHDLWHNVQIWCSGALSGKRDV